MAEYIEREVVLKIIDDNCPHDKGGYNTEEEMGAGAACYYIRKAVNDIPTADVAPRAEWISIEERLPETEGWYLVYTAPDKKHRSVNKAEFCKGFEWNNFEPYWRGAGGHWGNVTHWMPMPLPPHKSDPEQEELPL